MNKLQIVIEMLDNADQHSEDHFNESNALRRQTTQGKSLQIGDVSHLTLQHLKKWNLQVKIETKHKSYEEGT